MKARFCTLCTRGRAAAYVFGRKRAYHRQKTRRKTETENATENENFLLTSAGLDDSISKYAPAIYAMGSCRRCGVLSAPWPGRRV